MTSQWHRQLRLRHPVMQAGMGGGISSAELVLAVGRAGGLGTLGLAPADAFRSELKAIREGCDAQPFAANLLMPFTRREHVEALLEFRPAVVSLFFGFERELVATLRSAGIFVLHQVGDAAQAQRAIGDGADGLIAQGEEGGGHLAGTLSLEQAMRALRPIAGERPVLAAGGIHDARSAATARGLGADGVAAGTRFLLTNESHAHAQYKERLLKADLTLRTSLFGLAWPAPHRVVENAATARWCTPGHPDGPRWAQIVNTAMIPARHVLPMESVVRLVEKQRLSVPLYSPAALTRDMNVRWLDVTPLYAGKCVSEIRELRPAADVVAELARGFGD